jgi:tetratricopeptide (TPR) repeat protein
MSGLLKILAMVIRRKMKKFLALSILLPMILLVTPNAIAAGGGGGGVSVPAPEPTPTPTPTATQAAKPAPIVNNVETELATINNLISNKNFTAALAALKIADSEFANNADVNNLLGYSSRKLKQYKEANTYYTKALKLDPKHLGALEYQGELFMETKKVADAKKNLAKLKSLCGVKCEYYLDLKKVIGNK